MKLNRNYDKWEEWQKIAYPLCRNKKQLEEYELIEEIRIGRNYIFLIDVPELPDRGFMRLFLNGHNFQSGGTIEYGKKRLAQFAEGIRNKTLRVSYDTPLYYDLEF